jgi:hypothetical protein
MVSRSKEGRPFWFKDKFPDPGRDGLYSIDPWFGGATQIDDLGVLFGIIKETRPKTIVEIGFFHGDGTRAMLSAKDSDASIFSFDPWAGAADGAKALLKLAPDGDFHFFNKYAQNITREDVKNQPVDFVFFDAGHELKDNQAIWASLQNVLADNCVIAVHDTGAWSKKFLDEHKVPADSPWRAGEVRGHGEDQYYLHINQRDERSFINWIHEAYPDYEMINLHSLRYMRNGITLLQRYKTLDVSPDDAAPKAMKRRAMKATKAMKAKKAKKK